MNEEAQWLEANIQNLKDAYSELVKAMNNIVEIDALDDQYKQLERIADEIDNERINLEIELEQLEETMFYEEKQEQWQKERQEELEQFWKSRI